jgi:hypothetical protein
VRSQLNARTLGSHHTSIAGMDSVDAALRAVRLQHSVAIIAFVSAFVLPGVSLLALRRMTAGRTGRVWAAAWLAGGTSALLYAAVAFVFSVCWGGQIGESGKSRLARAYGAPVIIALRHYDQTAGAYPERLADLVPGYLKSESLRAPDQVPLQYPFEYKRDSLGFQLLVRYVGPGMNECRYTPTAGWHCGGYF